MSEEWRKLIVPRARVGLKSKNVVRSGLCISCLVIALATTLSMPVLACWSVPDVAIDRQVAEATQWGAIRVVGLKYAGLRRFPSDRPGVPVRTWVDFEWVDTEGKLVSAGVFSHEGAAAVGGMVISTMPHLEVGKFYIVLLTDRGNGLEPVRDAMSALEIQTARTGDLSPWDSVRVDGLSFVPPGGTESVTDAQVHELIDGLASIEARGGAVSKFRGAP